MGFDQRDAVTLQGIERHLDRIATVLETREKRDVANHQVEVHLDSYPPDVQELIARLLIPGVSINTLEEVEVANRDVPPP